jgi:glycosyltransferase involved in cell wall biosynthesis
VSQPTPNNQAGAVNAPPGTYADARWIGDHGIGRVARELITRLAIPELPARGDPAAPMSAIRLSRALRRERPKLLYSPGFVPPFPRTPTPAVITLHDLIHLDPRAGGSRAVRAFYHAVIRPHVRSSPLTLTVSETSRNRIAEWASVDLSRIAVVHNGVSPVFTPKGPRRATDRPTVLYVGSDKPHKNLNGLLRAFALLSRTCDAELLLAAPSTEPVQRTLADLGIQRRVRWLTRPTDEGLAAAYRAAAVTVVPSFDEGFGLPAVESMACGTPVALARAGALPEVAGAAAEYFDPHDPADMADVLRRTVFGAGRAQARIDAGLTRAAKFHWNSAAAALAECLHAAVNT